MSSSIKPRSPGSRARQSSSGGSRPIAASSWRRQSAKRPGARGTTESPACIASGAGQPCWSQRHVISAPVCGGGATHLGAPFHEQADRAPFGEIAAVRDTDQFVHPDRQRELDEVAPIEPAAALNFHAFDRAYARYPLQGRDQGSARQRRSETEFVGA